MNAKKIWIEFLPEGGRHLQLRAEEIKALFYKQADLEVQLQEIKKTIEQKERAIAELINTQWTGEEIRIAIEKAKNQ